MLLGFAEELLDGFATRWKGALTDWCDLETGFVDAPFLVTQAGGCVSAARIDGLARLYADAELPDIFTALWPVVASASALHDIEFTYWRDPIRGAQAVEQALDRLARRAATAGIGQLERLTRTWRVGRVAQEGAIAALWTHPGVVLTRAERRQDSAVYARRHRLGADFRGGQDPYRAYAELIEAHAAAAAAFFEALHHCHVAVTPLPGADLLAHVKHLINPHQSGWTPHLAGDPAGGHAAEPDAGGLLWLPLRNQLFDLDAERTGRVLSRWGDTYYGSVQVTLLPQRLVRFSHLRVDLEVPLRLRFFLTRWSPGFRFKYQLNRLLAGVMNWPGHERNQLITRATQALQPLIEQGQTRLVRVVATTWGTSPARAQGNLEKLISGLQHWGQCQVKPIQDDPVEGVMSSLPALHRGSAGEPLLAPKHLTALLPVDRPVNVFRDGVVFRTRDGQPWFYQQMGDEQPAWVTQIVGGSGAGKSVLLAALTLAFVCQSGSVPYLGLIEIKPSARGLFELVRELAAPEIKKRILYRRLTASARDAINPFDTFLGCRRPLPHHGEFLIRFLLNIAYSFDAAEPEKDTTELVTALVDEVYSHYLDDARGKPKAYAAGVVGAVDEALTRHGLTPTTWFGAADGLFQAGAREAAELAHRQSMPLLRDAAVILKQADRLREVFGAARTRDGQPLIEYVHRQFVSALGMFPQLTAPTQVDLGAATVIGLDLEEVAPAGYSERERRVTTVAYLLARHLVARYVFLRGEHAAGFAPPYRADARRLIAHVEATPKAMVYDEAHILQGLPAAESLLVYDARIARQYLWSLTFCTQLFEDLTPLIGLTTTRFIVGAQTEEAIERIHAHFRLTAGEREALLYHIRAPTAEGSHVLALVDTKRHGPVVQHLRFPAPAFFLWAVATSRIDDVLKGHVLRTLSLLDALDALAGRFPAGSAKGSLDSLAYDQPDRDQDTLITQLADSVLTYHLEQKTHAHA